MEENAVCLFHCWLVAANTAIREAVIAGEGYTPCWGSLAMNLFVLSLSAVYTATIYSKLKIFTLIELFQIKFY